MPCAVRPQARAYLDGHDEAAQIVLLLVLSTLLPFLLLRDPEQLVHELLGREACGERRRLHLRHPVAASHDAQRVSQWLSLSYIVRLHAPLTCNGRDLQARGANRVGNGREHGGRV